jgi:hypothetical protein
MPLYLEDLPVANRDSGFQVFHESLRVASLGWPEEVVRQWLYDHGDHTWFLEDYGTLDLSRIRWDLEDVAIAELERIPTGPSEQDALDEYAANHQYWLSKRSEEIRDAWETRGTWLVAPILISCKLLHPSGLGLQVIEGRTRVGILQGRRAESLNVADTHKAWVGRAA